MDTQARRQARGRNFAFSLFISSGLLGRLFEEEFRRTRVRTTEFGLLSAIGLPGGVTPTALAEQLGVPPTTLSARIRALEQRRYVRRIRNVDDGRSYRLELTPAGRRAWERGWPALRAVLARTEEQLDVPIDDLEETLVELERALRAALASEPA
jgi:DNA-binding MarR family transcriptional regulator